MDRDDLSRKNRRTALVAFGTVGGMVGLSFAAVPLYNLFCRVTGYNGTVQRGQEAPGATDRTITVRFAATTHPNLPWRFQPEQPAMTLRLGEEGLAFYTAANRAGMPDGKFDRWVRAEEVAALLAYLASEASSATSGALIPIYGRA